MAALAVWAALAALMEFELVYREVLLLLDGQKLECNDGQES